MAAKKELRAGPGEIVLDFGNPNPKQIKFIKSTARYTGYGGARGGGKTWVIIRKSVALSLSYPGIKILMMRKTYKELQETIIEPMMSFINSASRNKQPAGDMIARYNATVRAIYFLNGSKITFGHLQHSSDITEYQGAEYDVIFMDEATHFTEWEFRVLGATLRGVNDFPKRFYLTCNPGGVGHQWVKRLFVTKDYEPGENPKDYLFIPATVEDNEALMKSSPEYIQMLDQMPPDLRAAHRYGDWDALSGQFFGEVKPHTHFCEPFAIPATWPHYRCFDYGLDMFACFWYAIDETGRKYVYREYYESNLTVSDAAAAALNLTSKGEKIEYNVAPPDMWNRSRESGRTQAQTFAENGLPLVKANNNRVQGWMALKEDLKLRPDGKPGLLFFTSCPHIMSDLQALQHDAKNASDVAKEPHDITHGPDAIRYGCVTYSLGFEPPPDEEEDEEETGEDYKHAMCGGEPTASYMYV